MVCINSVTLNPKSVSLQVGKWYYCARVEVCPSNADCKSVMWHSDNPQVASVNTYSGYVYANQCGQARIYATAMDGSGCSDYYTVTVSNTVAVDSVILNRSSLSLEEGQCATLCATVCPDNATNKNVNWTSSNTNVATVNNGVVTAISKGSATIYATAADGSGCCACCSIVVTGEILVTSISITPTHTLMNVGESMFPVVKILPSNAANCCLLWSSNNEAVATVNPQSGLVTAQSPGTATITATTQDGSQKSSSCVVTARTPVPVESISVCPEEITIPLGETATLSACLCPSNATNRSIQWESDDETIATVGRYTGIVTAVSGGETRITATAVGGNCSAHCFVTVDDRPTVTITKVGDLFEIAFPQTDDESTVIWKTIGRDMSLEENKPQADLWGTLDISEFPQYERNLMHNTEQTYTAKQLALAYLIDPLGVEYYMKYCIDSGDFEGKEYYDRLRALLYYKDAVYKAIFGESQNRPFAFHLEKVGNDVQVQYYMNGVDHLDRLEYFTTAEALFGEHNLVKDEEEWKQFGIGTLLKFIECVFRVLLEDLDNFLTIAEYTQLLFFSDFITSATESGPSTIANEFIDMYVESVPEDILPNDSPKRIKAKGMLRWIEQGYEFASYVVSGLGELFVPVVISEDLKIYTKIKEQNNYRVLIDVDENTVSFDDIVAKFPETE